jgi:L-ascorbate metabolism protein UlaG (beta-lactamase superfamily)
MRITWHGHSCFEVKDGVTVVTDPHDGKSIGVKPPVVRADIVLISHEHFDHNCARIVRGDFKCVRESGRRNEKGVDILGIPAFHDDSTGTKRGKVNIFRFVLDGVVFCHLGDLGHMLSPEIIEELLPIDVLFIPVGGVFTIDGRQARELITILKPKVAVPMHFRIGGLSMSIHTINDFLEELPEDKIVRVGNEIEFMPDELPEQTEYWIFSP